MAQDFVPMSRGRLWLIQAAVGLGVMTTTAESGGINVALYRLAQTFEVSTATASWLILIGFLTVTSTLLLFGRLSDMLGNKAVFTTGFLVFAVGSVLCALAPSFALLLAARGVQTVGVSMLSANSSAILTECFPVHQRGTALGINSTLVGAGFFIGPILGGFVLSAFGWQYVFLATVPVALIGFTVTTIVLPAGERGKSRDVDVAGALLFALAATCLLLALNQVKHLGWTSWVVLGLLGLFGAWIIAFLVVEQRSDHPMVDLSLFSIRLFSLSLLSAFFVFIGSSVSDLVVPLFVQQVLLLGPATAGVVTATIPFVRMFVSSFTGWLSDRTGTRILVTVGALIVGTGIFGLSRLDESSQMWHLVGWLVLIGVGSGTFFSPNMSAKMGSVPRARLGMASSGLAARRNLGQSVGIAVGATLLPPLTGLSMGEMVTSFQAALTFGALAVVLGAVTAALSGSTAVIKLDPQA